FLTDIFILSAEKQPIKLSWRKIEWLRWMAGVLTPGQHRKCMSRIRSRNTKPSVRNEHLNGALFTLNHLFLENFAVRHAVSYGESGRELNLVAAEDKTEYEKDKPL
ncbi:hypothetical protein, partial [Phocaeicola vulgatus]